jgi:CheY-like chemotaxis protein
MPAKPSRHILVIDDEPVWLSVIEQYLHAGGYGVVTARSGAEALQALTSFTPDLIFSDVRMPDMNGFDLVEAIKQLPATRSTPIVFVSAIDDYDARRVARDVGAVDYLVKPIDAKDVGSLLLRHFPERR